MIIADIKHATHLEHYGEFATLEDANAHLTGKGWELERVIYNGLTWRRVYEKGFQVMVVAEAAQGKLFV